MPKKLSKFENPIGQYKLKDVYIVVENGEPSIVPKKNGPPPSIEYLNWDTKSRYYIDFADYNCTPLEFLHRAYADMVWNGGSRVEVDPFCAHEALREIEEFEMLVERADLIKRKASKRLADEEVAALMRMQRRTKSKPPFSGITLID